MKPDEAQTIYKEYMLHARHIEQQQQSFAQPDTSLIGEWSGIVDEPAFG